MRKGLFAIVLVAASFAGGAMVNGPGLRWVRDMILNQPGAEIATTTLVDPTPEPDPGNGTGVAPVEQIPAVPIPPLVIPPDASASPPAAVKAGSAPPWPPAPAPPRSPEPKTPAPAPHEKEKGPGPLDPRGFAPVGEPAVKPPSASNPIAAPLPLAFEPPAPLSTSKDRDAAAAPSPPAPRPIAAAASVDPEVSLASLPPDSTPTPAAASGARAADDWGTLRRKMQALGVARYGIEGEPDGRVRFHCVIPLAGRRAVGQQFEAEGADEIEAAQTALRRVALWCATEHPAPGATAPPP